MTKVPDVQIELEFRKMLVFEERGKPENPEKNLGLWPNRLMLPS